MKQKMAPQPKGFIFYSQPWKIKWFAEKNECMGITYRNLNEIHIFTAELTPETIKETLLHELLHVVLTDVIPCLTGTGKDADDAEESLIRLISPRLWSLLTSNKELREFIYGK